MNHLKSLSWKMILSCHVPTHMWSPSVLTEMTYWHLAWILMGQLYDFFLFFFNLFSFLGDSFILGPLTCLFTCLPLDCGCPFSIPWSHAALSIQQQSRQGLQLSSESCLSVPCCTSHSIMGSQWYSKTNLTAVPLTLAIPLRCVVLFRVLRWAHSSGVKASR